jgi:hypothetical protein
LVPDWQALAFTEDSGNLKTNHERRKKAMRMIKLMMVLGVVIILVIPSLASAESFAVWLEGNLSDGGNAIPGRLDAAFGAGSATLVTTTQLETPGFLSSFDAVVVSRFDASFGSNQLSALAAANIAAYVGAPGPSQGGVAVFTNDMADNLLGSGSGDPFDPNLDALFVNAATFAAASHHGYIGEFNGAVYAVASNSAGFPAMGLLPGSADAVGAHGSSAEQFVYDVGPIGSGNPIDAGVTFPFTDSDVSTYLTFITGADPNNIVDIYTNPKANGYPAVLANEFVISGGGGEIPEPATMLLLGSGLLGAGLYRRFRKSKKN